MLQIREAVHNNRIEVKCGEFINNFKKSLESYQMKALLKPITINVTKSGNYAQ